MKHSLIRALANASYTAVGHTMNVLLVEDNIDLATTVVEYLQLEAIHCDHASNGINGLQLICTHRYDVILLDINLPKMNGFSLCQAVRQKGIDTPVIMLTARDQLGDKLEGFSAGTDDYLVKPFELEERPDDELR
jgi:DNA-binding response OmpR family regulator